jgi:hypothetical protein
MRATALVIKVHVRIQSVPYERATCRERPVPASRPLGSAEGLNALSHLHWKPLMARSMPSRRLFAQVSRLFRARQPASNKSVAMGLQIRPVR